MYCDALVLAAVLQELRGTVLGGRIQHILSVDQFTLGFEIYANSRRHYLLMSGNPSEGGRIHLVQDRLRRGVENPAPLLLRLRKQAQSAWIADIQQLPGERVLSLQLQGEEGPVRLVVEIMGRRSNILLVAEDGTILDCLRHVAASQNRYRVLLPGYPYVPPPAQQKADASSLTSEMLSRLLKPDSSELPLWQKLVAAVRSVSPLLAKEISFRATGVVDARSGDPAAVLGHLQELLSLPGSGDWQPCLAMEADEVIAYAPYVLRQFANRQATRTISEAITVYYAQEQGADAYAVAKRRLQNVLEEERSRQLHKKDALLSAQPTQESLDDLRQKGELLLAFSHQASPHDGEILIQLDEAQAPIRIAVDQGRSCIENAMDYFRRYEKAKAAAQQVPRLLEEVDGEMAHIDQLSTDLALAEDHEGIAAVEAALAAAGYLAQSRGKAKPPQSKPIVCRSDDGFQILVGRNSWQNEALTFKDSRGQDIWLHAQGIPGSHVVIRSDGRTVPEATLRRAAQLAAYYSSGRLEKKLPVDYTLRKNVRRRPGGRPGQVVYRDHATIVVTPSP